ncbi:MAG: hypothetical protein ACK4JA_01270 [Parazoarcus communis]
MDLQTFVAALVSAPSADNAQPWQLQVDPEMLHCSYQPNSDGPDIFGPMGHASLLSAGALQENARRLLGQEAASTLNVSTASGTWSISIPLRDIAAADIRHKDALLSRHTNRHAYKGKLDHALYLNALASGSSRTPCGSAPLRASTVMNFTNGCSAACDGTRTQSHSAPDLTLTRWTSHRADGSSCDSYQAGTDFHY